MFLRFIHLNSRNWGSGQSIACFFFLPSLILWNSPVWTSLKTKLLAREWPGPWREKTQHTMFVSCWRWVCLMIFMPSILKCQIFVTFNCRSKGENTPVSLHTQFWVIQSAQVITFRIFESWKWLVEKGYCLIIITKPSYSGMGATTV